MKIYFQSVMMISIVLNTTPAAARLFGWDDHRPRLQESAFHEPGLAARENGKDSLCQLRTSITAPRVFDFKGPPQGPADDAKKIHEIHTDIAKAQGELAALRDTVFIYEPPKREALIRQLRTRKRRIEARAQPGQVKRTEPSEWVRIGGAPDYRTLTYTLEISCGEIVDCDREQSLTPQLLQLIEVVPASRTLVLKTTRGNVVRLHCDDSSGDEGPWPYTTVEKCIQAFSPKFQLARGAASCGEPQVNPVGPQQIKYQRQAPTSPGRGSGNAEGWNI